MILRILTVAWNLSETQADKSDIWGDSVFLWKCKLFSGGKHEVWHQTGGLESWEKPSSVWKNIFLVSKDFLCKTLFNSYITVTKIHSKLEYIMLNNKKVVLYLTGNLEASGFQSWERQKSTLTFSPEISCNFSNRFIVIAPCINASLNEHSVLQQEQLLVVMTMMDDYLSVPVSL